MRLMAFAAVALAVTATAGNAAAGSTGSWGSGNGQANGHVLICLRTTTAKTVTVRGHRFYPGELTKVNKPKARDLVAAKKAAQLDEKAWRGHSVCLIDANGRAIPNTAPDAPPPPPPPPPVVKAPPPSNSGSGGTSGDHANNEDDDTDADHGGGNEDDDAPPPPPAPE